MNQSQYTPDRVDRVQPREAELTALATSSTDPSTKGSSAEVFSVEPEVLSTRDLRARDSRPREKRPRSALFPAGLKHAATSPWIVLTVILLIAGGYSTWLRFERGLGAATNLSDEFPWGIWIGFDVLCGVGLAAGGFTICALVHILNMQKYRPLLRPAVLTAFIGYVLVVGGLMFDLGHPLRIWHPIVMWNPHSVMFEVAWCVTLYTIVLALEVSILFFERFQMTRLIKIMHALAFPLSIASVLLSMLHQSSLGSLFLIVPGRLHELWYTPLLPLLFFLSAIGAGMAMVIVESNLSARGFGHELPRPALLGAARFSSAALLLCLVVRFADLMRTGALYHLRLDDRATWFFVLEIVIGFVLPILYFNSPTVLKNRKSLYRAAQLCLLGFIINRLNVSVTGFEVVSGHTYVPAWTEVAVTFTIIAVGVWAVYLAERFLPVLGPIPGSTNTGEDMRIAGCPQARLSS